MAKLIISQRGGWVSRRGCFLFALAKLLFLDRKLPRALIQRGLVPCKPLFRQPLSDAALDLLFLLLGGRPRFATGNWQSDEKGYRGDGQKGGVFHGENR
jgi:hypothetical protein